MRFAHFAVVLAAFLLAAAAGSAAAQQVYRWTDETGRTHVTDTPPPAGAKDVRRLGPGAAAGAPSKPAAAVPYVLDQAMKQYPVTLYTSPECVEPCARARELLNKRGVPFKEVQVWDEEGADELKRLSGNNLVPAIKVGASVFTGFERSAYEGLLDSAGYPRAGVLPARAQSAPGRPEGYVPPEEREKPRAEPVKPEAKPPAGPYAPK
ncbi:MAG TPA: glutaredoxin family protein [Burkholderiales bacterium]|nr:glutaredoxin family protein [Burkholderiales bacterium]